MPQDESWSWIKFLKGPLVGRSYAKAIVIGLCQLIILSLIACVVFSVFQLKGCQKQNSQTKIGSNAGVVNQTDSHSQTTVTHYHLPLSDILNWLNWNKIDNKGD